MLKKLALLSIWLALPLAAQTVNPNQIRPGTTAPTVLTTTTADQPPSWQPQAAGVGVAAATPCTVNGGAGPVTSGTATVFCPSSTFQYAYTQQGTGQYVLVPFTSSVCSATTGGGSENTNGSYGPPLVLSSGGFFITGGQNGSCTFSNPVLPSGVTTGQITAIYAVGWKAETNFNNANPTEVDPLGFSGTSISGGAVRRNGSGGGMGPTPLQYGLQLTGTFANFSSITATAAGATNFDQGGGSLSYTTALEVDYTGTPVVQSGTVNLGPGFGWDPSTDTLSLVPFAIYPITVSAMKGLPEQPATTYNLVLDGASTTDCSTGGGSNTVWCKADGAGGFTGIAFGGGSSVTWPTSGDIVLSNGTNSPAGLAPINGDCPVGSGGVWTVGSCGSGGGGLNGTVTYTSSQTASSSDNGKLVIMNCSGACAYTLPATQPSTTWQIALQSVGSTTATVGLSGDTYNGGASAPVLPNYYTLPIWANSTTSTDYRGGTPPVQGTNMTITPAANGQTYAASVTGSSPLTTKGDLYGFDTANARIPVGSNGQVLTADSTQTLGVKWAAGGGGMTNLCSTVTLTSGATCSGGVITVASGTASVTLSSISGGTTLLLRCVCQSTSGSLQGIEMQFNGDTGSNYNWQQFYNYGNTYGASNGTSATALQIGALQNNFGVSPLTVTIPIYSNATPHGFTSISYYGNGSVGNPNGAFLEGNWTPGSPAAITSITLFIQGSSNFGTSYITLEAEP